jgi:hypothetical protein
MTAIRDTTNPFTVQTPEDISADDTISLFVNVFSDFHRIPHVGHCFLHGPRGSGKSMMFRFLQPDCQCLHHKCAVKDLPFFGIYVPIKNTSLDLAEFGRVEKQHAAVLLNEHFLVMYIAVKAFASLRTLRPESFGAGDVAAVRTFHDQEFVPLLKQSGWKGRVAKSSSFATVSDTFGAMERMCDQVFGSVITYLKRLSFANESISYTGPLCGFADFLLPLVCALRSLPFMPQAPVYLLIDDADNLNLTQTRILNSWVSSRSSSQISIKVSTQLNYKTYSTTTGRTIDAPHDYSEINISDVYTSPKSMYRKRVREIVERRLALYSIDATPEDFFPTNPVQDEAISKIADGLRAEWDAGRGSGFRADDDISRYARPDYIRGLKGRRKQGSNYSYAGFAQLVDISSGIIRYFLEAAALMFTKERGLSPKKPIRLIRHQIQSDVVKELADKYMFSEFDKLTKDEEQKRLPRDDSADRATLLRNLILSMGRTFHEILISDRSERRVFSIALYDSPKPEVAAVLDLGVQYGYFHQSTIGNKDGTGRTWLYVLSRRLAPFFLLDPTGFAGYLFVKSDDIDKAMRQPGIRLRNLKTDSDAEEREPYQLPLFETEGHS